jgi:hypothetical protein
MFVGIGASYAIGYWQGRRPILMLENLLLTMERNAWVTLHRDAKGRITGGNDVTVQLTGQRATFNAPPSAPGD